MKQIGILGGTFDPPHIGHFIIADEVKHQLQLDEIWFIPTNEPPHKKKAMMAKHHRVNMLNAVIEKINYFKVNTIECNRIGKSYTIDTINTLKEIHRDVNFYFIIGADMVEYLPYWKDIEKLEKKIQFVGVKRPGFKMDTAYSVMEVKVPLIDISSTEVKHRIEKGLPVQFFLPNAVLTYIKEHRLYESE
ncbi:nicotinate-nucleotide adenylyltransferase [Pseudogracilibacillus sp. SO30301A]|uniref:nicotinate-nucleotide adenylyltransferase n=1 Tax=Pseudogracilibacillus sp. SO30301A TaxID=3098291 RepID=UPI00300DF0F5